MKHKKKVLVLVETSRIYGRQIIEGITRYAFENGNWIVFLEDRGLQKEPPQFIEKFQYDGIISRSVHSKYLLQKEESGTPVIELLGDGKFRRSDVLCDGKILGRMAADYFLEKSLKHFAFFSTGHCWWSDEFCTSFTETLQDAGFGCNVSSLCLEKNSASLPLLLDDGTEKEVIKWLRSLSKPTGLFCPSDSQAIFILNLCQIAGITVPNELFVLGVENNKTLCEATSPPLSSIAVNGFETGYRAAELLERKMNNVHSSGAPLAIPPISVITRESTDFIAVADQDVSKALFLISQEANSTLSVKQIAKHLGISVRTLIRKFHETLDRTPEEEIMRVKMERAKALLSETELPIGMIARNIGYASKEYFIRVFRNKTGMTPHHYRKLSQSNEDEIL